MFVVVTYKPTKQSIPVCTNLHRTSYSYRYLGIPNTVAEKMQPTWVYQCSEDHVHSALFRLATTKLQLIIYYRDECTARAIFFLPCAAEPRLEGLW